MDDAGLNGVRLGISPKINLLVGKVLDDSGHGYDTDIMAGVEWAWANGARVISMSFCSDRGEDLPGSELYERMARRMLESEPSVLLVAAAGNGSVRPYQTAPVADPACCPSIVSVGAIGADLAVASFSARQMDHGGLDIVAPGVEILSWGLGSTYCALSGTSMACPHVAGAAALIFANDPAATAASVRAQLIRTAKPVGPADDYGAGIVQVP